MFQRLTLTIIALAISHLFINGNAEDQAVVQVTTLKVSCLSFVFAMR